VLAPTARPGWLVAGTRLAADGSSTATVWISPDGSSWRAAALTGPQVDSEVDAATSWRGATVVVGSVGRGADSRAAVWLSTTPGAAFVQVAPSSVAAGQSTMSLVSGGPLGLFATGQADGHLALWYSSNGRRWTRLTRAEHLIAGADDAHVGSLLANSQQGVYAAGWQRQGSSMVAAVWSSNDGINWYPIASGRAAFAAPGDHLITSLAPFGTTGLVAVGGSRIGSRWTPASWISPNGVSWSEPSGRFALGARAQLDAPEAIVRNVEAVATGEHSAILTAVGGGPTAQRMWTSTDGLHWAEVGLPASAAASDGWDASQVAVAGSTSIVVDADPGQPHVLVRRPGGWQEPSRNAALFGPVQTTARPAGLVEQAGGLLLAVQVDHHAQAVGPATSSVAFLTSSDGTTWAPVAAGGVFAGGTIAGVAGRPGHLVAVGWRQVGVRTRATVWTSSSGLSWNPGTPLDAVPVAGSDVATGACVDGAELAVVGVVNHPGGSAGRVWVSRDGTHWTVVVTGSLAAGTSATMSGCTTVPTGREGTSRVEAFGSVSSGGAVQTPAFWSAAQPGAWTRLSASPFGDSFPFPAVAVARAGNSWLVATGVTALAPGSSPSQVAPGQAELWRSAAGGDSWQQVDTSASSWLGAGPTQIDRVAWLGAAPVVAGAVDGRLAVWVGIASS
jgi:hypothetical protein